MHHSSHEEAPRIRPSLPRLKNKASIGRLIAYGGVLDFEGSSITPSTSTSTPSSNTTHLAGPASSSPPSPLPPINNTIMHSSTGKQDQEALLRTPTKNTSQATLRALKQFNNKYGVNTSIHTPSNDGVAPPPPSAILALDLDQHWTQTGCGLKSEQSQQQLQNAQSSSVPCSSLDGPASTSGVKNDSVKEGYVISSRSKNTITEDEERLAREIREDMDDGGYASLEQVGLSSLLSPLLDSVSLLTNP